jgi:hypothetical protein
LFPELKKVLVKKREGINLLMGGGWWQWEAPYRQQGPNLHFNKRIFGEIHELILHLTTTR